MLLSPAAALLQIFQFGDLLVIPLVAGFGWNAAPAYYNVIAGVIHWAHNGGISLTQLDAWTITQGRTPQPRPLDHRGRSITYVDDSCGHSSTVSVDSDMGDIQTVISQLLGPAAYNKKKTEGPLPVMTIIGWKCDLRVYTIQPGSKGQCKMYYWVFRGLDPAVHMPLTALQSAVGTLRWYSAVVPMASTWELQRVLTTAQRRQSQLATTRRMFCKLSSAAVRELHWWQWILTVNLTNPMLEAPAWHLARDNGDRVHVHAYTDASSTIGGGYYIDDYSYGQFKWSPAEKLLFGRGDLTDINGLEFVTAVCAVIGNREYLRGKVVHLHVDNTAAVTWLNKQRTSQLFGQTWIKLLISVLLTHDILLDCVHIAGEANVFADALSRFLQHKATAILTATLEQRPLLSAASREIVWSMPSTPLSPTEYLSILDMLERQDSEPSSHLAHECP